MEAEWTQEDHLMCGGAYFNFGNETMRMYFANPKAVLPVLRNGEVVLLPWGRRLNQEGVLPATGWAKLESIYGGIWEKYHPIPVKIPALSFMEKDFEGHGHWYDLQKGQFIQGLVARAMNSNERRVYVVTLEPELEDNQIHARWPRVVQAGEPSR
jgi:hypothetical protein